MLIDNFEISPFRDVIIVDVQLAGLEHIVKQTLMTVPMIHVCLVLNVLILSMISNVIVHRDSPENDVKIKLIYVPQILVFMVYALIDYSIMNVFVNLVGMAHDVKSIPMNVLHHLVKMMPNVLILSMAIDVFVIQTHSLDLDVNMKSMHVNLVRAKMVEHV